MALSIGPTIMIATSPSDELRRRRPCRTLPRQAVRQSKLLSLDQRDSLRRRRGGEQAEIWVDADAALIANIVRKSLGIPGSSTVTAT